jgi:hypothetical protein
MALDSTAPVTRDEPTEAELLLAYVRRLQRDGRVLLRHIAGRGDRAAPPDAANALLFDDAATVAADPPRIAELAAAVDALSRAAAPATAAGIRLTRAYLRNTTPDDDEIGEETMKRGLWLYRSMVLLAFAALVVVLVALALLAHVDDGRRAQQQWQSARAEVRSAYEELARMPPSAWVPSPAGDPATQVELVPLCRDEKRKPSNSAEGIRANGLCNLVAEAEIRLNMAQHLIEQWNCRTEAPWAWLRGRCPPVPRPEPEAPSTSTVGDPAAKRTHDAALLVRHWNRTEIRAEPAMATLKGFVLPLFMGFLGGAAYVLRRFSQKLSERTVEPQDGWHAWMRVLLATMLGGLLGAVWSGNEAFTVGGVDLSLAAAAFFVGFALEAVFSLIEAMVASVSGRIRGEPAPPPR